MQAIMTIGIPCSGKTTWAREYARKTGFVNISRDDIRFAVSGAMNWGEYKFNRANEETVTKLQEAMIRSARAAGKDVIISDTNLNPAVRERMSNLLKEVGYTVTFKEFHVTLEEAYKRDALRLNGVGNDVIYRMYRNYLEYTGRRTYTPDISLPEAVCFDVDGTVADMEGIRRPFEWEKVHLDRPRDHVIAMVEGFRARGNRIIFLSGRDGVCEAATREGLNKHVGHYDAFFIRTANDQRKDTVIKEELFWEHIAGNYNVVAAIDDRPCVVRLWHELGIKTVAAVGNPYIEF